MFPGIEGIGVALGSRTLSNDELAASFPEWDFANLTGKTGVFSRPIALPGETALDLGERACRELDARGLLKADEIDAVIFCTETPDHPIPPNACVLHDRLNLNTAVSAFDITLACSGFTYGLMLARSMILSEASRRVLLVTADTYSRLIHDGDRATRALFGDGGAATIISADAPGLRILDVQTGTAGSQHGRFIVRAGGSRMPRSEDTRAEYVDRSGNRRSQEHIEMDGLGVLSFFNSTIPGAVRALLAKHQLTTADVDLYIFHQASTVALEGIRRGLNAPGEKFVIDMAETGNLVSASIPVAISRAQQRGRLAPGQRVVVCGFGVGLSWATALIQT
jgi:3-oxoacyl-[acyl-carrier-protein] synthase-3